MDERLTESEPFALRPELVKLMRVARFSRLGALYGAWDSAQTFETIAETSVNPIDFEEIVDEDIAMAGGAGNYSHVPGFDEYDGKSEKGQGEAANVHLFKKNKKAAKSKTHFGCQKCGVFAKNRLID